jgi:hypothetical protein
MMAWMGAGMLSSILASHKAEETNGMLNDVQIDDLDDRLAATGRGLLDRCNGERHATRQQRT